MTEDGLKSVIVKVGLTALVLACVGDVRDKPSDNRNTTVQVVEKISRRILVTSVVS